MTEHPEQQVGHDAISDEIEDRWSDVECPSCGSPLGTNNCLSCLYAYESVETELSNST